MKAQWQIIGTAPQDGTEILIWDRNTQAHVAYWNPLSLRWTNGVTDLKPTHWMPLPGAPK